MKWAVVAALTLTLLVGGQGEGLKSNVHNARSNVVRAVRKAHAEWSWSAWQVDYLCGL